MKPSKGYDEEVIHPSPSHRPVGVCWRKKRLLTTALDILDLK